MVQIAFARAFSSKVLSTGDVEWIVVMMKLVYYELCVCVCIYVRVGSVGNVV